MGITDRDITVYGESYGGGEQRMSHTYGDQGRFIVFDVQIGECWLEVPKAEKVAHDLGLEFVHYVKVSTDLKELDDQRDAPSIQAIRNGVSKFVDSTTSITDPSFPEGKLEFYPVLKGYVSNPKKREGVVLHPLIEVTKNNGERIICKHKGEGFGETKTPRPVVDPAKMKVLEDAQAVADEWVTLHRLEHVLQKIENPSIEKMREVIASMVEDVNREASGEIIASEAVNKAIGKKTAMLYKDYLKSQIGK